MTIKKALSAAALAVATAVAGLAAPIHQPGAAAADVPGVDVRVASFNIQSVSLDRDEGARKPWRKRRGAVIRQILGERIDVIGVQEANPSPHFASRLVDGRTQYLDLRNGLNKAGGGYQVTNPYPFNCQNPWTRTRCVRKWRAASHAERILYNTRTLQLVSQGAMLYRAQPSAEVARVRPDFLAWAVLRVRATGTEFLFFTTHLEGRSTVEPQWRELIAKVNAVKGTRPVVVVGDFNTNKFSPLADSMLPAMRSAGYGDVLNQQYAENPVRDMRAQNLVHAWINSANHESRDVSTYSYSNRRDKVGNSIDWIFASNQLPVKRYALVLRFDPKTLLVQGVLPSDHNMVAATLTMP